MAADAAQLIAALGFDTLPVMGHSDGGCVAMHLLFDHEHVVSAAVISGAPYDRTGYSPAATTMTRELPAQLACGTNDSLGIRQALLSSGLPDETLRATGRALLRAWSSTPNFTLDMLRMIERPVLVIEAGADPLVSPEHMKRLAAAIPDARTLSMPTMTHDPGPHIAEISDAVAAFLSGLH
jgi:pimeloyl-ACP methyl ester carboxylesterase